MTVTSNLRNAEETVIALQKAIQFALEAHGLIDEDMDLLDSDEVLFTVEMEQRKSLRNAMYLLVGATKSLNLAMGEIQSARRISEG